MNKQYEIELWFASKLQHLERNLDVPIFARKKILTNLQKNLEHFYNYNQSLGQQNSEEIKSSLRPVPINNSNQISFQDFPKKEVNKGILNKKQQQNTKIKNEIKNGSRSQKIQTPDPKIIDKGTQSEIPNEIPNSILKNEATKPNLEINSQKLTPNPKPQTIISFQDFPKKEISEKEILRLILPQNIAKKVLNLDNLSPKKEENIVIKNTQKENLEIKKIQIFTPKSEKPKIINGAEPVESNLELAKDFDLQNKKTQNLKINTQNSPTVISFAHLPKLAKKPNSPKISTNYSINFSTNSSILKPKTQNLQQNKDVSKQSLTNLANPSKNDQTALEKKLTRENLLENEQSLGKIAKKQILPINWADSLNNPKIIIPMIGKNQIQLTHNLNKKINSKIDQDLNQKLQTLFQKAS